MWWRVALLTGLVGLALIVWALDLADRLDPASLGELLRDSGAWGPLLFLATFAIGNGLGAPGALFLLTAVAVWSPLPAFLLVWAGCVAAGVVGYAFARTIGKDWVEARLPVRLRDLDVRAAARPVRTVAVVRLLLFVLGPAHWALGLSSVRPTALVIGSALGFLPGAAFWTLAGAALFESVRDSGATGWLVLLAVVAVAVTLTRLMRRGAPAGRPS